MKIVILIIIGSFVLMGCSVALSRNSAAGLQPTALEAAASQSGSEIEKVKPTATIPAKDETMIDRDETITSKSEINPKSSESKSRIPGRPLFTFSGSEPSWYTVDDRVMGGISSSVVRVDPNLDHLTFSGNVSLENNGGFASTRSDWVGYDLRGYDGILMRVFGDGNVYRFRIRTSLTGPEVAYTAPI